ncbi:MAG: hypothetical protein LBI79_03285 [Nitrososphaerota archaeon]|nr:hypothetical protein [Nitrososphaerota archaeon]
MKISQFCNIPAEHHKNATTEHRKTLNKTTHNTKFFSQLIPPTIFPTFNYSNYQNLHIKFTSFQLNIDTPISAANTFDNITWQALQSSDNGISDNREEAPRVP